MGIKRDLRRATLQRWGFECINWGIGDSNWSFLSRDVRPAASITLRVVKVARGPERQLRRSSFLVQIFVNSASAIVFTPLIQSFTVKARTTMEKNLHSSHLESRAAPIDLDEEIKERAGLPDDFTPASPEEEAAVIRRLDWHLLPFVFLLYMLAVLDRSNLGNAKLAGMDKEINLKGWRYNWLGTIFYIACKLPLRHAQHS